MANSISIDELSSELDSLRNRLEVLESGRRGVRIGVLQPNPFLGQPVSLVVNVVDFRGIALAEQPVLVTASWGRLRLSEGPATQQGSSISTLTGADGSVRLTLLPATSCRRSPSLVCSCRLLSPRRVLLILRFEGNTDEA